MDKYTITVEGSKPITLTDVDTITNVKYIRGRNDAGNYVYVNVDKVIQIEVIA